MTTLQFKDYEKLDAKAGTRLFEKLCIAQLMDLFMRDPEDTVAACSPPDRADRVGLPADKTRVLFLHNHVPFQEYRRMDYHAKSAAARKLAQQHQKQVIL